MSGKALCIVGLIMTTVAIISQVDIVRQPVLKFIHNNLGDLLNKCPYHVLLDVFSAIGLSNVGDTSGSDGERTLLRHSTRRMYTQEELSLYKGEPDSPGLYLAILGRVYNVKAGDAHYGPGKGYSGFAGRDGTRAFVTGNFKEQGLVDDVEGLELSQIIELEDWMKFYEKTYIYLGKVIGNFYNEKGQPTRALLDAQVKLDAAYVEKSAKDDHRRRFPPCNSAWTQQRGGSVSCSNKSGGISRDWVGVPRLYHSPGSKSQPMCVCVRTQGPPSEGPDRNKNNGDLDNPHLKLYSDCLPEAISCKIA